MQNENNELLQQKARELLDRKKRLHKETDDFILELLQNISENHHVIENLGQQTELLRKEAGDLLQSHQILQNVIQTVGEGITLSDDNGFFLVFNSKMEEITGYSHHEANSVKDFMSLLYPERLKYNEALFKIYEIREHGGCQEVETSIRSKNGTDKILLVTTVLVTELNKKLYLSTYRDITRRKQIELKIQQSLAEKEILLREIHHRVKNNLQVVNSIVNLQMNYLSDTETGEQFRNLQGRIMAMNLVHENLFKSENLSRINGGEYFRTLSETIFSSFNISTRQVKIHVEADELLLLPDTCIPLGLIVNELISNSLKHGFPNGREGEILIKLQYIEPSSFLFIFSDDGIGFPPDFDVYKPKTLGLRIAHSLARQLNGELLYVLLPNGVQFELVFHESTKKTLK